MIRIDSSAQLLEAFRIIDRPEVDVTDAIRFPLEVKDYVAWAEPSGARMFLVFFDRERRTPFGVVFRRDSGNTSAGTDHAVMCEWCHAVRGGNQVGLLTATSSAKRRVGLHLCRDLSCKQKAEASPGVDDFPHSLDGYRRVRQITDRMLDFARRQLF